MLLLAVIRPSRSQVIARNRLAGVAVHNEATLTTDDVIQFVNRQFAVFALKSRSEQPARKVQLLSCDDGHVLERLARSFICSVGSGGRRLTADGSWTGLLGRPTYCAHLNCGQWCCRSSFREAVFCPPCLAPQGVRIEFAKTLLEFCL